MEQTGIFINGGADPMEARLRAMIDILRMEFGASVDDILEATVAVLSQIDPELIDPADVSDITTAASETVSWNVEQRQDSRRRLRALGLDD